MVTVLLVTERMLDLLYFAQQHVLEANQVRDIEAIESLSELKRLTDKVVKLDGGVAGLKKLWLLPPLVWLLPPLLLRLIVALI